MYFPTPLTPIVWLRHCRGHAKSPERQSPTCRLENSTQVADNDYGQLAELLRQTSTVKYSAIRLRFRLLALLWAYPRILRVCSVLQPSSSRGLATPWTYFLHLSLSSVILIDSSTGSPVHVLMLSIQAVRGLPRLRAPGTVPCIICFLVVWP